MRILRAARPDQLHCTVTSMDGLNELAKTNTKTSPDAKLRIFDCDVHPFPQAGLVSLTPYLPAAWRERFARKQAVHDGLNVPIRFKHPNGSVVRQDARTPEGLPPASSPQYLVADLIETHNISGALLNCFEAGGLLSVQASTEESIVLAAAYDDLFIEEWLSVDKRLKYAAAVPTQDPGRGRRRDQAGRQASSGVRDLHPPRRFDDGPSLLLADLRGLPGARPAVLHPCHRHRSIFTGTPTMGPGTFDGYLERYTVIPQIGMVNVNSLILSGALERFPRLNFIFAEYGFLWLTSLLFRMDRTWRGLRHETPVGQEASERVPARALPGYDASPTEPDNPLHMQQLIAMLGHDVICFSTDYPHWDNDMPDSTQCWSPAHARPCSSTTLPVHFGCSATRHPWREKDSNSRLAAPATSPSAR